MRRIVVTGMGCGHATRRRRRSVLVTASGGIDFVASQARPMAMGHAISKASASEESMPVHCSDAGRTNRSAGSPEALVIDALRCDPSCFSHANPTQGKK